MSAREKMVWRGKDFVQYRILFSFYVFILKNFKPTVTVKE
jgi:hypothetical protein